MACVTTKTGVLEGFIEENGVSAWLGVPFAKPPVGGLRWKPAQRLEDSGEHVACLAMGPSAAQFLDEVEPASLHEQSEDCLYLNIWVKDPSKRNQPVMVYIHGGAYFSGGAADPLYYGANFAANHDVVLVSINYRLNVFGSLQLSVLPGEMNIQRRGTLPSPIRWPRSNGYRKMWLNSAATPTALHCSENRRVRRARRSWR